MDKILRPDSVQAQLIIAAVAELEAHGPRDFSLRRVAAACNLSCAAPYKHFHSRDELITAVYDHIHRQLRLLLEQVDAVYAGEPRRQLVESGVAYVRFCLANPSYRAVLALSGKLPLGERMARLAAACCPQQPPDRQQALAVDLRSLIHGVTLLLASGELPNDDSSLALLRRLLEQKLP